ncbi:MAG: AraC family transcriptional regulator [Clostridia bacterium]|nr:AraC family transcriptional regulator [Clostridia bacterium]
MVASFPDLGFVYSRCLEENVENKHFILHNHKDSYEIYIFLQGDAEFLVEGTHYPLRPYDMILAQSSEMHYIHHHRPCTYERIVINIDHSFFLKNNCAAYKEIFVNRPLGVHNCIPASTMQQNGIPELLKRMESYLADGADAGVAANSAMVELLYLLNRIGIKSEQSTAHNDQIKDIILYLNAHLTEPMSLEAIAEHFYISKGHLCRSFKKHTGFTVNGYITYKRLLLVKELKDKGRSWIEASGEAGFGNYSNFYKIFRRTYGHAPTGE